MTEPATILIIDDDAGTCETAADVLRLHGYAVETASRGRAGLAAVSAHPVHAAIIDLRLPDMSGLELLDAIKRSTPATEVIFITGHASLGSAIQAMNGAAFAYLTKPFEMEHLMGTLERALEKRRLTQALEQSEERYRFVTENIMDAVFLVDLEGRLLLSNPRVAALTGYGREELQGRSLLSLLDAGDARDAAARLAGVQAGQAVPSSFETRLRRRDGHEIWVEASLTTVTKDDRVVGVLGVARDITERRRAEEALRRSHQTLHALIDGSPLAIVALELDGTVKTWNRAAERMFGWMAEEALGCFLPAVPDDRREEFRAHVAAAPAARSETGVETRWWRKDGSPIDVSVSLAALPDPEGAGVIVIAADITERRQLEDQLRQAQKLEAIGSLAGGIAHDFNNLLTVIGGRSHIMGWRVPAGDPLRRDIEIIEQTSDRAAALTRQLLAFSRKQVLQPRVLDLNDVVTGIDRILQRLIGEHIELAVLAGPEPARVRADPSQIEQVILNLAVNSRDAMPAGGRLTIETKNVRLEEEYARTHVGVDPGAYVMLAVSDTGHGMDAATQAQLFVPFFTTKEPGRGTGLGLATVYGIVKQSGGHIWVYSEVGRGTTFKMYLPRVDAAADAVIVSEALPPPPRGVETVLLAEDDEGVRMLARETLEGSGYTVLEARNPEEALRLAREHRGPIHLLVTDVVMPAMSGRALADQLATTRPGIPVLFMSGYTGDAIVLHGVLDAGAAFLQKPFTPSALARQIRNVLDQAR
jgi:two-component system cell cycle sensor histidine kinase/response regulator CckA